MINLKVSIFFIALCASITLTFAQSTTNSPYSKFGIGIVKGSYLPQNRAMGNIAYGISSYGGYQNINISNPASYAQIKLTTFDVGATGEIQTLNKGSLKEKSFNGALSHILFGIPITKKSALSFGLLPYSNLGYNFTNYDKVETLDIEHVYTGEGGLSKAYLGYGVQLGKHISIGANLTYLFGNLKQTSATEYSKYIGYLNSKKSTNNSVGGLLAEYGVQYVTLIGKKTKLTLGYAGNTKTNLNSENTTLYTRYQKSVLDNREFTTDTISFENNVSGKLTMPSSHNFGFSIEKLNKWLIGADYRLTQWSDYRNQANSANLNNSWGFSLGGQITPDINAVSNYLALIDYRLGFNYDKTNLKVSNTDIKSSSINFGFGFPLLSARTTFYKVNFAAELGKRGTTNNNLVKENFVNLHLGFTINDRWFQKYKYD